MKSIKLKKKILKRSMKNEKINLRNVFSHIIIDIFYHYYYYHNYDLIMIMIGIGIGVGVGVILNSIIIFFTFFANLLNYDSTLCTLSGLSQYIPILRFPFFYLRTIIFYKINNIQLYLLKMKNIKFK